MYSVCESYPLFAYLRNNAKLCHATVCHELKNLSGMHSGHSITRPSYEHNNPPPHVPRGGRTRQRPLPSQSGLAVSIQRLSTPSPVLAGPADADNRLQVTGQTGQGVCLDHCCYPRPPISESLPHFQRAAHDGIEGHVTSLAFALLTK